MFATPLQTELTTRFNTRFLHSHALRFLLLCVTTISRICVSKAAPQLQPENQALWLAPRSNAADSSHPVLKPSCGLPAGDYSDMPLGLPLLPRHLSFTACACNTSVTIPYLQHTARAATLIGGNRSPNFNRVHGYRQNRRVVGCRWTWACLHSPTRYPEFYEEAQLATRSGSWRCGSNMEGTCRAIRTTELVLRRIAGAIKGLNGMEWGLSQETRNVGFYCELPRRRRLV